MKEKYYDKILRIVSNHLQEQGYDLRIQGKDKTPKIHGFTPTIYATKSFDEILIEIETDPRSLSKNMIKWRRFSHKDAKFWIVTPDNICKTIKLQLEAFNIPAEVYSCNGEYKLKKLNRGT